MPVERLARERCPVVVQPAAGQRSEVVYRQMRRLSELCGRVRPRDIVQWDVGRRPTTRELPRLRRRRTRHPRSTDVARLADAQGHTHQTRGVPHARARPSLTGPLHARRLRCMPLAMVQAMAMGVSETGVMLWVRCGMPVVWVRLAANTV